MTHAYLPTLHRLPEDTTGRFAVLREFLLRWHGLDTGGVGRTVERVAEAEGRIGRELPLAVREWIVLLDDIKRIDGWARVLRDAWGLKKVPNCAAFSLLVTGEDDGHWGPMLRDLDREDPPTHEFILDYETSRFKRARKAADRVSTWAVEFILSYLRLSQCLEFERGGSKFTLVRLRERPERATASRVGHTELFEFEGGLIVAAPDGPTSHQLHCYAPYRDGTRDGYYAALEAFRARVDAMLAP